MTTHLTGFDLTDQIAHTGMIRTNTDNDDPRFETSDPEVIGGVQKMLIAQGYTFVDSKTRGANTYMTLFRSPGNASPRYVELEYVNQRYIYPFLALCYIVEGRLVQFIQRYRSFVVDATSGEARDMVEALTAEIGEGTPFYWVPILPNSPLAHV